MCSSHRPGCWNHRSAGSAADRLTGGCAAERCVLVPAGPSQQDPVPDLQFPTPPPRGTPGQQQRRPVTAPAPPFPATKAQPREFSQNSEDAGPALLLGPVLGVVCSSVVNQLDGVGLDQLLAAVLALFWGGGGRSATVHLCVPAASPIGMGAQAHTMTVSLGALCAIACQQHGLSRCFARAGILVTYLTGRPLALTGARVPAASAFL